MQQLASLEAEIYLRPTSRDSPGYSIGRRSLKQITHSLSQLSVVLRMDKQLEALIAREGLLCGQATCFLPRQTSANS